MGKLYHIEVGDVYALNAQVVMSGSSSAKAALFTLFGDGVTAATMIDESSSVYLPLGVEDKDLFVVPATVDGSSSASVDIATMVIGGAATESTGDTGSSSATLLNIGADMRCISMSLVAVLTTVARSSTAILVFEFLLEECLVTLPMNVGSSSASVFIETLTKGSSIMVPTSTINGASVKVVFAAVAAVAVTAASLLTSLPCAS